MAKARKPTLICSTAWPVRCKTSAFACWANSRLRRCSRPSSYSGTNTWRRSSRGNPRGCPGRGSMHAERTSARPYFIWWDQDVTEQDLRDALAGDNLYRRVTVMSYIVNDADFDDVWKYLSVR